MHHERPRDHFQPRHLTRLRPALPGLTLAVLTLLSGLSLGGLLGLNWNAIESR